MGVISLDHIDNLFWLGRYAERVYATLRLYFQSYDAMIDITEDNYIDFCTFIKENVENQEKFLEVLLYNNLHKISIDFNNKIIEIKIPQ